MTYTDLTKLANVMTQQSEQEKKPSKATYIPALAGLTAGGALAYQGQRPMSAQKKILDSLVSKQDDARGKLKAIKKELAGAQSGLNLQENLVRKYTTELMSETNPARRAGMEKARDRIASELQGSRESVARLQKRLAPLSSSMDALTPSVDKERKSLIDLTTARNKKVLGGLGLLGLGVGTTALLRRRKKRKQQMAQQQAGGMPKAASAPRKTLRQLIDGSRRGEGHEAEMASFADYGDSLKEKVDNYEDFLRGAASEKPKSVAKSALKGGLLGGGLMTGASLLSGQGGRASALGGSAIGIPVGALLAARGAMRDNKANALYQQLLDTPRQEKEEMMRVHHDRVREADRKAKRG